MEDTEPIHLTGEDAELATLLCDILDDLNSRSKDARDVISNVLVTRLGVPMTRDAAFGRPGPELVGDLGRRILELIDFGLSESFVIRALRDEFDLMIDAGADVGAINARRAATQQSQLALLSDPDEFRAWCEERRAGCDEARWTDEQVAAEAERVSSADHLVDLSPDRTAELWATRDRWKALVDLHLTDTRIRAWDDQNLLRRVRQQDSS